MTSQVSSLQFCSTPYDGTVMVEIHGDVEDDDKDAFSEAVFQGVTASKQEEDGSSDIVLDLSGVTYLSEEGLAVLLRALKFQLARGAKLRILRASLAVRKKIDRMSLSAFFPIEQP